MNSVLPICSAEQSSTLQLGSEVCQAAEKQNGQRSGQVGQELVEELLQLRLIFSALQHLEMISYFEYWNIIFKKRVLLARSENWARKS